MKRLTPVLLLVLVIASFAACKRVIDLFPDGGLDGGAVDGPLDTPYWYDDGGLGGPFIDAGIDTGTGAG